MPDVCVHLLIHGRVQGVGYRAFLQREAAARGLSGWVRNLRSGEVEAVACGEAAAIEGLVAACRSGPLGARVDGIVRTEGVAAPAAGFAVRATG